MTPLQHDDIVQGLMQQPARIAPKYFYDERGSQLFEAITRLEAYYPTRTEASLVCSCAAEIASAVGSGRTLIELGAGNCEKSRVLSSIIQPRCFVGVDIASDFLEDALTAYRTEFPGVDAFAVTADLSQAIALPDYVPTQQRLVFYPGSSIGNFDPSEAEVLLTQMRSLLAEDGGLLVGIDLPKPVNVLEAAYDDPEGVTAAFNRNVLRHINRLIDSDFDERQWRHRAFFNGPESRIEMHLEAAEPTSVQWREGGGRRFQRGECIHTENSYKYPLDVFLGMLQRAGWAQSQVWRDPKQWFALVYARP